ncbi:MAG: thiamine pyrophosphate-binding protein [Candidatus Woesebacteria bacterium]|jgi:acetolactate synthase-1/2/3 large subunit
MNKKIKLSDYLAKLLAKQKVKYLFMIPGGGAMHLNDSFGHQKSLDYICNHHEQASAIAAEAYARTKNDLGVCVVTTGPGGSNTLTGLIGAWLDSIPVLFISGQVKKTTSLYKYPGLRQLGVQEIDIINMVEPVTKYAAAVLNPQDIKYHLEKAVFIAKSGRPGPVWLDIPLDVQSAMIQENKLRSFLEPKINTNKKDIVLKKQISKTLDCIKKAKRPVVIAGFGIRLANGIDAFYKLIKQLNIPVITSMLGHDLMWESNRLYAGRFGVYGNRAGNFTVQNSDLILVLGSRLHLWETGYQYENFAREALKIMVNIDKNELKKPTVKIDLPIHADVKLFMEEMSKQLKNEQVPSFSDWLRKCKTWCKKYPVCLPEYKKQKKLVNSYYFMDVLSDLLKARDIIITGNGTAFTGSSQAMKLKKGQRLIYNVGCASMGYALPAAIGAYYASKEKRIILITGDGSIQMNLQELQTIIHHRLPIKIFVLNNDGYLAIRISQKNFFKRYTATDKDHGISFPDILKIAKAYGIPAIRIKKQSQLEKNLKKVLSSKGPYICEIMMPPNQALIPKLTTIVKADGSLASTPLEDMYPLLNRKEFKKNMMVKTI